MMGKLLLIEWIRDSENRDVIAVRGVTKKCQSNEEADDYAARDSMSSREAA